MINKDSLSSQVRVVGGSEVTNLHQSFSFFFHSNVAPAAWTDGRPWEGFFHPMLSYWLPDVSVKGSHVCMHPLFRDAILSLSSFHSGVPLLRFLSPTCLVTDIQDLLDVTLNYVQAYHLST